MIYHIKSLKILTSFVIAGCILSLAGADAYASLAPMNDYEYGYGPIASLNNDWILAGGYMGYSNPSNLSDSGFHATFSMVLKNGTAYHMHQISNATLEDVRMEGNNTIMEGSITVTMRDGPVSNVPTTWTISNNNTMAISMDPSKINDHFGDTPIYGIVQTPEKEMEFTNMMSQDSAFMDKWIPIMVQNTMSALKIDSGNMSMMSQPLQNQSAN
ncbi:hypothetical protein [Candidatus Nitrosocosmicus franklandus]|uniref:Uncharacterized protein n=1 Tax=Candidatus Nitrosocosmicus franklandianus TaxID=1798806 RepID=A0A484I8L6_9ARCH|nr:hypothetical protein [Candidatus Nitrosocosmicus franklandus]VFJ13456.1 conserved exported protein of unknown function [Candidatus Nitrosocosmicus franklandus]